ncbi:hypothetical protein RRG08_029744 [Elysia crispata]|uniref:Uncharacterized protein n=1 Tax=Elysia crispata TaxID=231223 RepID=A0AAE1B7C4_9GAST|nr:hypothetical protein RRG08_029744 [Elysia crispata]
MGFVFLVRPIPHSSVSTDMTHIVMGLFSLSGPSLTALPIPHSSVSTDMTHIVMGFVFLVRPIPHSSVSTDMTHIVMGFVFLVRPIPHSSVSTDMTHIVMGLFSLSGPSLTALENHSIISPDSRPVVQQKQQLLYRLAGRTALLLLHAVAEGSGGSNKLEHQIMEKLNRLEKITDQLESASFMCCGGSKSRA